MATLTAQVISRSGLNPSLVAADVGGDEFVNTGKEFLWVDNADAAGITVTLDIQATVDGQAVTDRTVSVPAANQRLIGPFPSGTYNDTAGKVQVTYSAVANVTVAVVQFTPTT